MTYEEILEKLKEVCDNVSDFAYDYVLVQQDEQSKYVVKTIDGVEYNVIEGVGAFGEIHQEGGEGQGDHWESVKFFPEHNIYIKVVGHYSSYNGTDFYNDWGCCYNVTPKEKTITVYEQ